MPVTIDVITINDKPTIFNRVTDPLTSEDITNSDKRHKEIYSQNPDAVVHMISDMTSLQLAKVPPHLASTGMRMEVMKRPGYMVVVSPGLFVRTMFNIVTKTIRYDKVHFVKTLDEAHEFLRLNG